MTKNQEDTLNMYQATNDVLQAKNSVWAANVPFSAAVTLLEGNIDLIEDQRDKQSVDTTGVTQDKQNKRQELEDKTFTVGSIIKFYASTVGNRKLLKKVDFKRSELERARDNELPGMSAQVHEEAVANAPDVLPFGLTATMTTDLGNANAAYVKQISKPRSAKTETSSATEQLPEIYNDTNTLLVEQLDSGMELFRTVDPEFYSNYFNARIIVNSPTQKRSLEVHITDANGVAIEHVRVVVDGSIHRRASSLGNSWVQSLSEGAHSLTATLPGRVPVTQSFNVIAGETTKITLTMMAV